MFNSLLCPEIFFIDYKLHQKNVVKLHYEKHSPLFRDDFKELEIFLDEIVPLLEDDEIKAIHQNKNTIKHLPSDGDHYIEPIDTNKVTPVANDVQSRLTLPHHEVHEVGSYVSPFHLPPIQSSIITTSSTPPLVSSLENEQEEHQSSIDLTNPKYFSGLIPHAINIQINIPPSDDREYKESDSYRDQKHISVSEKPGYKSPLSGVIHHSTPAPVPLPPALPSYNPTSPPLLPDYNPSVTPAVPDYKPSYHPSTTVKPHLLPHHPHPADHYEAPSKEYLPPHPHYESPKPASYEVTPKPHHLVRDFKPPHAEYLPPSSTIKPSYEYEPSIQNHLVPSSTLKPHYEPPHKEYLPPKLPGYHDSGPSPLLPGYKEPSKSYLPPSSDYIPPADHHHHHPMQEYHPPSKEYLPPPAPHHHAKPGYEPPTKEYLPPALPHHTKPEYIQPSHPVKHGYEPPSKEYLPPTHHVKPGYEPPSKEYLPPHSAAPSYDHMKPPTRDYLPPSDYLPPNPELITDIDGNPIDLLHPPNKDYLPPPPRLEAGSGLKYVPPPPRDKEAALTVDIINGHNDAPRGDVDHYIPPKTLNDVPKNFIRPEDILPPPPELLDVEDIDLSLDDLNDLDDYDGDSIEITLEDLESLGLPGLESLGLNDLTSVDHPFLGLAKFRDGRPKTDEKRKSSKKKQKIELKEDDRFEKLRVGSGELPFPPMPTTAPDSLDSVPIIERLKPDVLAKLRKAQAAGGAGGGPPGFIPGKAGVDYPDFRSIPNTDFTCENFILPGFYADTFTSCQVRYSLKCFFLKKLIKPIAGVPCM